MPPRRRSTRSTRAKVVDMHVSDEDEDMEVEEEDPIVDVEEVAVDDADEDEGSDNKDDELEDDEQEESEMDAEEDTPDPGPSIPPRLRIKLKLPQLSETSSLAATATSTPDGSSRRRILSRGSDIESEDEDEDDDSSTRSGSVATPGRPLTARQAVLRNVVDSSHVSLAEPTNSRKKKQLTELEIALKREETARKRKNLSEKKLEDEKAETINRLLKKQSRTKGKRNALSTAEDRPTPGAGITSNGQDIDMDNGLEENGSQVPTPPTMFRWLSTTRSSTTEGTKEPCMLLSFSVPVSALSQTTSEQVQPPQIPPPLAHCDFEGCGAVRKYRLVKDWRRGACSMMHLKALEAQSSTAA